MKLSVVIPVYNEGEGVDHACEAVREVLRKDIGGADWEILFVDDASTDGTQSWLRALRQVVASAGAGASSPTRAALTAASRMVEAIRRIGHPSRLRRTDCGWAEVAEAADPNAELLGCDQPIRPEHGFTSVGTNTGPNRPPE